MAKKTKAIRKSIRDDDDTFETNGVGGRHAAALAASDGSPDSLDRVRDILFGNQQRDTERRLGDLEEQIQADMETMRDDIVSRVESAVEALDGRISDLSERLDDGLSKGRDELRELDRSHTDAMRKLDSDHSDKMDAISTKLKAADAASVERDAELKSLLTDESAALREELAAVQAELTEALETATANLTDVKADREALADLFTDAAARLSESTGRAKSKRK